MIKIDLIDELIWEHLPTFKIIKYFQEHIIRPDFKPFAQAQICCKNEFGLVIRMLAFEVEFNKKTSCNHSLELMRDSTLSFVISNKQTCKSLIISFNRNQNYIIHNIFNKFDKQKSIIEKNIIKEELKINCFEGEDLQGIYWGGEFLLHENLIRKYLNLDLKKQKEFDFNFIKSCFAPDYYHCGGFCDVTGNWDENMEKAIIKKN